MKPVRNHRIVVSRRGGPDVLLVVEEDLPEPQPGEVRVKVVAAGVSAYDLMIRSIWFPGNPHPPFTPGEDIVGVVDRLGEGVSSCPRSGPHRSTTARRTSSSASAA